MKYTIFCLLFLALSLPASGELDYDWYGCGWRNPCGQGNNLYFYPSFYEEYFVQCGETRDQCYYQRCAANTTWNQTMLACVTYHRIPPPPPVFIPFWPLRPYIPGKYSCESNNPCNEENVKKFWFYFTHYDDGKYITCDLSHNCFTMDCPTGLKWDAASFTCDRPRRF